MKQFIILEEKIVNTGNLFRSESNIRLTSGYGYTSPINTYKTESAYVKHEFDTYQEALDYAQTLNYGVVIYESIAETKIEHTVTRINENTKRITSK